MTGNTRGCVTPIVSWDRRIIGILALGLMASCGDKPAPPPSEPLKALTADTLSLPGGATLHYAVQDGQSTAALTPSGTQLKLEADHTIAPNAGVRAKPIGQLGTQVILATDEYPSRPGGMSYCQAGHEQFLRVFSLTPQLHQTFQTKTASCIDNKELADPGIVWKPETATLEIHWLTETKTYKIDPNGTVH